MHRLVLVVADESVVSLEESPAVIADMMEPYSESLEVPEYDRVVESADSLDRFWLNRSLIEKGTLPPEGPYTAEQIIEAYYEEYPGRRTPVRRRCSSTAQGNICERSTFNPDAHWDWYQVGGRWSGWLRIKPGRLIFDSEDDRTYDHGEKSWANEDEENQPGQVDTALMGDMDFTAEFQDNYDRAAELYDRYSDAIAPFWPVLGWQQFLADRGRENIDAARAEYATYSKPFQSALEGIGMTGWGADPITQYGAPHDPARRHEIAHRAGKSSVIPSHVLFESDGWHESPANSWSFLEGDQDKHDQFVEEVWERLHALPETARIWAVDIHS